MKRFSQSPTDPAFVQDPYAFYDRLRAAGDLVFWEDYGMVAACTHRAVSALLRDRRFGREIPAEQATAIPDHLRDFYRVESHSMLELEPPRHTRLRGLVLRAFTSRRIAALRPEIDALCRGLADALDPGPVDLLPSFAQKLPVIVIARLLGVPEAMAPQLLSWSNAMVAMYQANRTRAVEEAANAAARAFLDYLSGYVQTRRSSPGNDLMSDLIAAEQDGARLSNDELLATCILLLNAGHEATVHAIGNGLAQLLSRGMRVTEDTAETASEEILRFDPPLHMFTRYAYEDVDLFGHGFRRGEQVALLLGSANRDRAVWPDADRFDPTRPVRPHVAFGGGLHFCVGAPLARLELQIALPALFARHPALALAAPPVYADSYHFHGLTRLMVTTS